MSITDKMEKNETTKEVIDRLRSQDSKSEGLLYKAVDETRNNIYNLYYYENYYGSKRKYQNKAQIIEYALETTSRTAYRVLKSIENYRWKKINCEYLIEIDKYCTEQLKKINLPD